MPAADEFPRGWVLKSNPAAGVRATLSLPAVVAVQHVLEAVSFRFLNNQVGANVATVQVTSNGVTLWSWTLFGTTDAAGVLTSDDFAAGLNIAGSVQQDLTVEFAFAFAGYLEMVSASGHDI